MRRPHDTALCAAICAPTECFRTLPDRREDASHTLIQAMGKMGLVSPDEENSKQLDVSAIPSIETSPEYTVCSSKASEIDLVNVLSLLTHLATLAEACNVLTQDEDNQSDPQQDCDTAGGQGSSSSASGYQPRKVSRTSSGLDKGKGCATEDDNGEDGGANEDNNGEGKRKPPKRDRLSGDVKCFACPYYAADPLYYCTQDSFKTMVDAQIGPGKSQYMKSSKNGLSALTQHV
jgi:hypothetical protein